MRRTGTGHAHALIAALLAALLMGMLCVPVRESGACAQLSSFSRFGVGFVVFAIMLIFNRIGPHKKTIRFSPAAFFSGVSIGLCVLFYFMALKNTSAAMAAMLPAMGPFLAAFWEPFIERQKPPRRDVMLLVSAGVGILLVCSFSPTGDAGDIERHDAFGILCGVLAALFYSFYLVINRFMSREVGMLSRVFWQSAAGTLVLIGPLLAAPQPWMKYPGEDWSWLLAIGLLQGVCVLVLVAFAMKRLRALEFGIISCLEPTEATLLGWAVYAESTMPGQWVGFIIVLTAIIVKSQRHIGWRIRCLLARRTHRHVA